jgi:hypothetical protein
MNGPCHLITASMFLLVVTGAFADDSDPIRAKLDKAKAAHAAQLDQSRAKLLTALNARENSVRQKGDKKGVDSIQAERDAFESKGELPKAVPTAAYKRSLKDAGNALGLAYKLAIAEYVKASRDIEATAVEKEWQELQGDPDYKTMLLGTWKIVNGGTYHAEWTFHSDGSVTSNRDAPFGKWAIEREKNRVIINWSEKHWDSFGLPLDPQKTEGDSWAKTKIQAVKIR